MAAKKFEKFFVKQDSDSSIVEIVREDRLLDFPVEKSTIVADFPNESSSVAEAMVKLLNAAYSEGHARGIDLVFEGIRSATGVDD